MLNIKKRVLNLVRNKQVIVFFAVCQIFLFSPTHAQTADELYRQGIEAFTSYKLKIAERSYLLALRKDSNHMLSYKGLIAVYQAQERYDDGLRMVEKAIQVNDDDADLWLSKGLLLREAGDRSGSKTAYLKAAEVAPLDTKVLRVVQGFLKFNGDRLEAKEIGVRRKQLGEQQ